jgi:hypothetical protein
LRGEDKTHISKKEGKTVVITDEFSSPIFDARFIFEMLINGEVYSKEGKGGYLRIEKITHEDIFACLPKPDEQIGMRHGEMIAKWCASPGGKQTTTPIPVPEPKGPAPAIGQLKNKLWTMTMKIHNGELAKLENFLRDNMIISDGAKLSDFGADTLSDIIAKTEVRMNEMK